MPTLEITTQIGCKNACVYCPQDTLLSAYAKSNNSRQMNFDLFKRCIDKIPLEIDIHFTGMCEPWLNPDCTKLLLYAHERGHRIDVSTTLVGMKMSDIDLIQSVPFKNFVVHLPSDEGYEKIKVDDIYLMILEKISKSSIKHSYHFHGRSLHSTVKNFMSNMTGQKEIIHYQIFSRAGNLKIKDRPPMSRKRGVIICRRNMRHNVLLPNGDVVLCCMDYGMKHRLGNLLASDYHSLFRSEEYIKLQRGLTDDSLDILCRHCDQLATEIPSHLWANNEHKTLSGMCIPSEKINNPLQVDS